MKRKWQMKVKGFTLIEMLLVLVVASMLIYMGLTYVQQKTLATRQDRTVLQMTQILNASLAYFISNGSWPASVAALQTAGFLPDTTNATVSPWPGTANQYELAPSSNNFLLYVWIPVTAASGSSTGSAMASAEVIAGQLPMAYTTAASGTPPPAPNSGGEACSATSTTCYVVASVNYPGQNLNNASAMNFAGVYHHGGCVPAPTCPVGTNGTAMTPQVFVVPVSLSGVNDASNPNNVYPISSFTAYVSSASPASNPPACQGGGTQPACANVGSTPASNSYWRACVQIVTPKGDVKITNTSQWGQYVTLGAFTRCAIKNEPSGSSFSVYSN